MGKWLCIVGILVFVILGVVSPTRAADIAETQKLAVANCAEWLKLVDRGDFSGSWQNSSSYFRSLVPEDKWTATIESVRKPLGAVTGRKLQSVTHMSSMPGAPDGEYFVIVYDTSFEHKATATETVTPMLDKDGSWLVAGYYIK